MLKLTQGACKLSSVCVEEVMFWLCRSAVPSPRFASRASTHANASSSSSSRQVQEEFGDVKCAQTQSRKR